ncbi:MAG: hypothetical protein HUU35_12695 [Armatimonadetes bacterium]|nr:hypothetical protein [Armatimonadota bacterium]
MSVYYDNLVLTEHPESYTFQIACPVGTCEERRWTLTPTPEQVGAHPFALEVKAADGTSLAKASTALHITRADAGAGQKLKLLIVGDSLTANSMYAAEIARLMAEPGNPELVLLGTNRPGGATNPVGHEGYGGWTWDRFARHYEPNPDRAARKFSSPFVFLGADGQPKLDVERYFAETLGGQRPDIVTFLLGINDNFSAPPDNQAAMDQRSDAMFAAADTLLAAFRAALPQADLVVGLTTPPNSRESGFEANYKGAYHRWGWKRIQHRLVERVLERFRDREAERLFLVPTELNLDPVDGYPVDNGVHPNKSGYQQIGQSFYAWLKYRLQTRSQP